MSPATRRVALSMGLSVVTGTLLWITLNYDWSGEQRKRIDELAIAADHADITRVRRLLALGTDPNLYSSAPDPSRHLLDRSHYGLKQPENAPPLIWALWSWRSEAQQADPLAIAAELLRAGADVNARDAYRRTALMWVQSPHGVELLCNHGANIDLADGIGDTALIQAAEDVQIGKARALLAAGAHISRDEFEDKKYKVGSGLPADNPSRLAALELLRVAAYSVPPAR